MALQNQYARHDSAGRTSRTGERGYAMAALLVAIASMSVVMSMALPVYKQDSQREKEAELIFRMGQYTRAIELFKRRHANAFPPNVDNLVKQKYLRKKYKDPITKGDFRYLTPLEMQAVTGGTSTRPGLPGLPGVGGGVGTGQTVEPPPLRLPGRDVAPGRETLQGPIAGVASRSTARSIRIYKNRQQYDQWRVTAEDVFTRPAQATPQPNQPGRPGMGTPGTQPGGRPSGGFGAPTGPSSRPPSGIR